MDKFFEFADLVVSKPRKWPSKFWRRLYVLTWPVSMVVRLLICLVMVIVIVAAALLFVPISYFVSIWRARNIHDHPIP